jgi:hypothetical protein
MQVEGESSVANQTLKRRDAIGIVESDSVVLDIKKGSTLLLMEVPLTINY